MDIRVIHACLFMPEEISVSSIQEVNKKRNAWMDYLQKVGISTRPATHAVHMLNFYKEKYNLIPGDFPLHSRQINVVYPYHFFMEWMKRNRIM